MSTKVVRTFTATERELQMLDALARYHGFSKSGVLTSLVKKEFWRVFPGGNGSVRPDEGARVVRAAAPRRRAATRPVAERARRPR